MIKKCKFSWSSVGSEWHTFLGGKAISLDHLGVCPKDFVTLEHCTKIVMQTWKLWLKKLKCSILQMFN